MEPDLETSFRPLLLGGGRLARHLRHYFESRGIAHEAHLDARRLGELFAAKAVNCSHVWLLVSDQALRRVASDVRALFPKTPLLHSSAATVLPEALTLHPLMTFGPGLYASGAYSRIPLTLFHEEWALLPPAQKETLNDFLRKLPNPTQFLSSRDRIRYHLSCVMHSNLPLILWHAAEMVAPPGAAPEAFGPILEQTLKNHLESGLRALTGPIARSDQATLDAHLRAVSGTPEAALYSAFLRYKDSLPDERKDAKPDAEVRAERA